MRKGATILKNYERIQQESLNSSEWRRCAVSAKLERNCDRRVAETWLGMCWLEYQTVLPDEELISRNGRLEPAEGHREERIHFIIGCRVTPKPNGYPYAQSFLFWQPQCIL
jgi:hypothetical protein